MPEKPKGESQKDGRHQLFEQFEQFVKKIAQVPKEEVDEKREQERGEKRAGREKRKAEAISLANATTHTNTIPQTLVSVYRNRLNADVGREEETMSRFSVGDKVQVKAPESLYKGVTGNVEGLTELNGETTYSVNLDIGGTLTIDEDRLGVIGEDGGTYSFRYE